MRSIIPLIGFLIFAGPSLAEERGLRVVASGNLLPAVKGIAIVKAGEPGPGAAKHKAVATAEKYKETVKLPQEGPYDVWWLPKTGLAVRMTAGVTFKDGEVKEFKVEDVLGVVNVRGDDQPRPALVTIAPQDDPGPGEKGHLAIQTAGEFRVDMAVPDGFYSLWITPENGARWRKIIDRFRAQAGKTVQLD